MAKRQIVIEIPEEEYENIKSMYIHNNATAADLRRIILNGIPLPKGHGRLIDTDDIALIDEQFYVPSDYYVAERAINDAPTIIEGSDVG